MINTLVVSSLTIFIAFRILIQPRYKVVSDLWLELKTFNSYIATALTALYAIYTYPLALGVMIVQIIFAGARPLTKSQADSCLSWFIRSIISLFWVLMSTLTIILFLFGTSVAEASKQQKPVEFLGKQLKECILEIILDYQCAGSRVWIFICLVLLPQILTLLKVLTN